MFSLQKRYERTSAAFLYKFINILIDCPELVGSVVAFISTYPSDDHAMCALFIYVYRVGTNVMYYVQIAPVCRYLGTWYKDIFSDELI